MKVAVIGAGWAGLAAAVHLHRAGCQVTVHEAAARPGGRARPVDRPASGLDTDNGQHILLGAYHDTLKLMRSLGVDPQVACHVQPLTLRSADGRFRLGFWPLPAPAHRLGALLGGHGLDGWTGRRHLWRVLRALDPARIDAALTVSHWLAQLGCPPGLMTRLWAPLCLAATNTPAERLQAQLFARVLADSLGADAASSHVYIPRGRLHALWPAQACALLGTRMRQQHVRTLAPDPGGGWRVDGEAFERVVLAVPVAAARRLLQPLPDATTVLARWPRLTHAAIGTLTLRLSHPWQSGQAMVLLRDEPARGAWGQWLFDHSATADSDEGRHRVHIVIGDAGRYADHDAGAVTAGIIAQIRAQCPKPLPPVQAHVLVTEKRATFDAVPGLQRPNGTTPWHGLTLAGDWTDTGYPAVLEGAVRSGLHAAHLILNGPA